MCGICGGINLKPSMIENMVTSIQHRGPDHNTVESYGEVGFGHARLSILDLSDAGNQPMTTDRYKLVYNGEIYNYQRLKERLDYDFTSTCDTEVILAGYQEHGKDIVNHLQGMYAFAIYDAEQRELFLARDRLGIKPLYYTTKDEFAFASETKAFTETGVVEPRANHEAVQEYLSFQNTFGSKTFYQDIQQVEPGTTVTYDIDDQIIQKKQYWDITYNEENTGSLQPLIKQTVHKQMISDVPVGTYLSGGFDSTTVTTFAAQKNNDMHSFIGAYEREGGRYDERDRAKRVADNAGVNLHEINITPDKFKACFSNVIHHLDEPTRLGRSFAQYLVAQRAAEDVTVTLTGHGGDELFGGYPVHYTKHLQDTLKTNPAKLPQALYDIARHDSRLNIMYYLLGPHLLNKDVTYGHLTLFSPNERQTLLKDEVDHDPAEELRDTYESHDSHFNSVSSVYLKHFLPALFHVEDRMSMAHGIESRVPLCDEDLLDHATTLSSKEKVPRGELKKPVKDAMKHVLPDELYGQEKKGFPAPYAEWFQGPLQDYVEETLTGDNVKLHAFMQPGAIEEHIKDSYNFLEAQKVWMLINLEEWMQEFDVKP